MFGLFDKTIMTATWQHHRVTHRRHHRTAPPTWLDEDLPFRNHAGHRTGRDD